MSDENFPSQDFQLEQCSPSSPSSPADDLDLEGMATDPVAEELAKAIGVCEAAIAGCQDDPGRLASEAFVKAWVYVRQHDPEAFFRIRTKTRRDKPSGVLLGDIEKMARAEAGPAMEEPQIADRLIELALELGELTHDAERKCYFTTRDAPRKTFRMDLREFKDFLGYAFYMRTREERGGTTGVAASDAAYKSAVTALSGIALHEGPEEPVWLRVAPYGQGYIIDLGDEQRRVVEVSPTSWRILAESPVKFLVTQSMGALPIPVPGAQLDGLWAFCNIPEAERPLVLAWILESLRPNTPHPVLSLCGQQGSAKSSSQRALRRLIDPNAVNLRAAPKCVEDVFVSAGVNWLTSFENISHLSPAMQDALCTLATGGGFAARTLFTNADETVIECKRPICINSIPAVVTALDLTDRTIHVELPALQTYGEEQDIEAAFQNQAPGIFGALLDLMSRALAVLPKVTWHDRSIRMVDFVRLGEAMMVAEGAEPGTFSRLYQDNRADSVARGLEASPVACAIRDMAEKQAATGATLFHGTMKELFEQLTKLRSDTDSWPRSPRGLGEALRRQAPALAAIGITITTGRPTKRGIPVTVTKAKGEHGERGEHWSSWKSPGEKNPAMAGERI